MPHDTLGFDSHDHSFCVRAALQAADVACTERAVQLTPVRRRVLQILLDSHAASGAYDVLGRLYADRLGSKPPVAYRALAFLVEQGFVHRVERLNAFIACVHPGAEHDPAFMICRKCGTVAEARTNAAMDQTAAQSGFVVEQTVIEAEGLCPSCKPKDAV